MAARRGVGVSGWSATLTGAFRGAVRVEGQRNGDGDGGKAILDGTKSRHDLLKGNPDGGEVRGQLFYLRGLGIRFVFQNSISGK
jgi:hypothetical protein